MYPSTKAKNDPAKIFKLPGKSYREYKNKEVNISLL